MATSMKSKTTTRKTTAKEPVAPVVEDNVKETTVEEATPVKETKTTAKKEVRKYENSEGIPCKSITPGTVIMEGLKSHIVYRWVGIGDVVDVEYQDLTAAIRSHNDYIGRPFIVVEDQEFVSQFPQLQKLYATLYSAGDLEDVILKLNPADMKATIKSLPVGAQNSIKHIASQMISNGQLDSVNKIKALDELFGTEMVLMTGLFN